MSPSVVLVAGALLGRVPFLAQEGDTQEVRPVEELSRLQEACGEAQDDRSWWCERAFDLTDNVGAAKFVDGISHIVAALAIVLVAWLVTRLVRVVIRRVARRLERDPTDKTFARIKRRTGLSMLETSSRQSPLRRAQRAHTIGAGLRSIASILIWTVAGLAVLGTLGVDLGPLLAGAGLLGLVVGYGAQTIVRDFLSGLFMIFEDQFGVGDIIDTGEAVGTVEHVSLRVTRLRDVNGIVWHVPNGEVHRIGNHSQEWSRALLDVDVAYDTDLDLAKRVILETAERLAIDPDWQELVLDPPQVWGVERFAADSISIRLVVKTRPLEQWKVARELRQRLKDAFDAHGIEIPFPQRTVWLHTDSLTAASPDAAATPASADDPDRAGDARAADLPES